MSQVAYRACDRCGAKVGENVASGYGVGLMVEYHHPQKLDLCPKCETEFTVWLGKHPLWGTTLEEQHKGKCVGAGYPSEARLLELFHPPRCDNYQNEAFCRLEKGHKGSHAYDMRDVSPT